MLLSLLLSAQLVECLKRDKDDMGQKEQSYANSSTIFININTVKWGTLRR